ncbi:DUF5034 domain-containing protein [Taibaiella soli]|uniref:DUF5034 domain-containing protein n=1 Tax=Taibaiella soli TaxID=1649169 RepID=A0A2W2AFW5_9BACT|nr:DUF5034 domain-containing protein [Taibaiella soli]PZF71120.1 hypothetical protein DN068_20705 [Taibaiella soli]
MRKKLLSLSILFAAIWPLSALLNSCNPDNCHSRYCTYVSSLDVKIMDNGDSVPHDIVNNELYAKALTMQITVTDGLSTDSLWLCPHIAMRSPFITTATAIYKKNCDDATGPRDLLDTFRITSNHDFDAQHPAGTDLQDIFYSSSPVKVYTGNPADHQQGLYTYYMRQAPSDTGTHVFTVTMHFTNGKVMSQSTSPVKLLK